MGLSRRKLLQGGVAVGLSGATHLRWAALAGAATRTNADGASWLSRSSYEPHLNTPFAVNTGSSRTVPLTLVAVRDPSSPTGGRARRSSDGRFSLLFTSAGDFSQGTYPIQHAVLGSSTLFMVPVGPKATPQSYEVIVNRTM